MQLSEILSIAGDGSLLASAGSIRSFFNSDDGSVKRSLNNTGGRNFAISATPDLTSSDNIRAWKVGIGSAGTPELNLMAVSSTA